MLLELIGNWELLVKRPWGSLAGIASILWTGPRDKNHNRLIGMPAMPAMEEFARGMNDDIANQCQRAMEQIEAAAAARQVKAEAVHQ